MSQVTVSLTHKPSWKNESFFRCRALWVTVTGPHVRRGKQMVVLLCAVERQTGHSGRSYQDQVIWKKNGNRNRSDGT